MIEYYAKYKGTAEPYFNNFFDKLAGNRTLRKMIISKTPESEIRSSWKKGINEYKIKRKKYLLYPDFE